MRNTHTLTFPQTYRPANPLRALARAFSAELLKMKRSLALWLTLIAPLFITGLQVAVLLENGGRFIADEPSAWMFITHQTLILWTLLMQPLFITLETALVAQLDHNGDHWKHLFSRSLPRWSIYTAKQMVCSLLIALSVTALFLYTLLSGVVIQYFRPGLGFEQVVPLWNMLWSFLITYLSAWLLLALHTWVAHYWRSFVVASGFGIFMTTAGVILMSSDYAGFYPWTLSMVLINNIEKGLPYLGLLGLSCLAALLITLIGGLLFTRRDVF